MTARLLPKLALRFDAGDPEGWRRAIRKEAAGAKLTVFRMVTPESGRNVRREILVFEGRLRVGRQKHF